MSSAGVQGVVRWGIAGAGRISADFASALKISKNAKLAAVAANSGVSRAQTLVKRLGDSTKEPSVYGSYEELAKDQKVDAVYIGVLNNAHVRTAVQFLEAGKPVLLEKPAAPTVAEMQKILDAAEKSDTFFQEAYWTRFMPATKHVRNLITSGSLGEISYVHSDIGFVCEDPEDSRMLSPVHYGGGLMDIGVYTLQFATMVFDAVSEVRVQATGHLGPSGVDVAGAALCTFDGKGIASLSWSLLAEPYEELVVVGSKGRCRLLKPSHAPEKVEVDLNEGSRGKHMKEVLEFPHPTPSGNENYPNSQALKYEIEGVSDAILEGRIESEEFTWRESLRNTEIAEEIRRQIGVQFHVPES